MKATGKKINNVYLLTAICLFIFTVVGCDCNQTPPDYHKYIKTGEGHIPADTTQQIVVWRTPNSDPSYLNKWLDSIHEKCGDFNITVFCGSCDSSLMLLTGNGIRTYISGTGTGKGGGTTCTQNCPPSGDGDTIYWAVNSAVLFNDPEDSTYVDTLPTVDQGHFPNGPITVAVFDTGIDTIELHNKLYIGTGQSCLDPAATNGWNFPASNNTVFDDYRAPKKSEHGAIVSRLIAEQVNHYALNDVRILPVKIHNERGESDLFSVLCGFAYAKERGAKIINASFGYYAPKAPTGVTDPGALLLKKYIEYYLTNHVVSTNSTILLVAAAGNTTPGATNPERNLDNISFYPASLASELSNVIAVTTVDDGTLSVSPHQNFSPNVVDVGVNTDVIRRDPVNGDHYDFFNPRIPGAVSEGSSFATPIVTGIICSHYTQITTSLTANGLPFDKENILNFLLHSPIGHVTNLNNQIKKGVMLNNARVSTR